MDAKKYSLRILGLTACLSSHAEPTVAIVQSNGNGRHVLYSKEKISPNDTVHFQYSKDGEPSCCAVVSGKSLRPLSVEAIARDVKASRPLHRYRFTSRAISDPMPFIGIAVTGNRTKVAAHGATGLRATRGSATAELDLCTSQEGVHVVQTTAQKLEQHLYLYLAYDIDQPTCDNDGLPRTSSAALGKHPR